MTSFFRIYKIHYFLLFQTAECGLYDKKITYTQKGFVYSSSVNNGMESQMSWVRQQKGNKFSISLVFRLYITYRFVVKGTYENAREG
ncbi:hypothetical protein [Peribacillus simplex]|uniref:hypothetical protein n=1 Tax=Peribacillus simplex TaxID=1478 RepID=UPI0024C1D1E7|nr:hypothetical protein [Peribacillus simplex]WHY56108.1 hypothetical protein QNH43_23735 [Peribacillus simplex]